MFNTLNLISILLLFFSVATDLQAMKRTREEIEFDYDAFFENDPQFDEFGCLIIPDHWCICNVVYVLSSENANFKMLCVKKDILRCMDCYRDNGELKLITAIGKNAQLEHLKMSFLDAYIPCIEMILEHSSLKGVEIDDDFENCYNEKTLIINDTSICPCILIKLINGYSKTLKNIDITESIEFCKNCMSNKDGIIRNFGISISACENLETFKLITSNEISAFQMAVILRKTLPLKKLVKIALSHEHDDEFYNSYIYSLLTRFIGLNRLRSIKVYIGYKNVSETEKARLTDFFGSLISTTSLKTLEIRPDFFCENDASDLRPAIESALAKQFSLSRFVAGDICFRFGFNELSCAYKCSNCSGTSKAIQERINQNFIGSLMLKVFLIRELKGSNFLPEEIINMFCISFWKIKLNRQAKK